MTAIETLERLKAIGGVLSLEDGDRVRFRIPRSAAHLVDQVAAHKPEVIRILKTRGGRIATLPHCPKCASYALYRKNNIGAYECQTCGLSSIAESAARRT
jgi:Zn ribbon nucleic-acid-binding protein